VVVRESEQDQQVGPPHHPEADLAIPLMHPLYGRQGINVGVDGVVEKPYGCSVETNGKIDTIVLVRDYLLTEC